MPDLGQILAALRAFAGVDLPKYSHDPRYGRVKGTLGYRWHLMHPEVKVGDTHRNRDDKESEVIEAYTNRSLTSREADQIGALQLFMDKRVPIMDGKHPNGQTYIIKPVEFTQAASYPVAITTGMEAMGAPVIPVARYIAPANWIEGDNLASRFRAASPQQSFRNLDEVEVPLSTSIARDGLYVVPYARSVNMRNPRVHTGEFRNWLVGRMTDEHGDPLDMDAMTRGKHPHLQRLAWRHALAEALLGAPDRHMGNYANLSYLFPGEQPQDIAVGIDYEFPAGYQGWGKFWWYHIGDYAESSDFARDTLLNGLESVNTQWWVDHPEQIPENPLLAANLDVLDRLQDNRVSKAFSGLELTPDEIAVGRTKGLAVDSAWEILEVPAQEIVHSKTYSPLYEAWKAAGKP